jgi:tetratricopeptide (TPR) repeat protein
MGSSVHGKIVRTFQRHSTPICLLICVAIAAVYAQTASFDFTRYDDQYYVTENPVVLGGLSARGVAWAFSNASAGGWMPITWLSHMLDVQLFGIRAGWHHLGNVLFHTVNSVLLFLLLVRCTSSRWRSGFVAALFALHPLHVESVAWIAERRDVLSTMWGLLAILAYVGWVTRRTTLGYLLVVLSFAASLLAKPMTVTLPLLLMIIDLWPLNRLGLRKSGKFIEDPNMAWRLLVEKIPLFLMAIIVGVLTIVFENTLTPLGSLASYPLSLRIANALVSYVQYLIDVFWPVNLFVHYPYPKVIPLWQSAGAGLILLTITICCLRRLWRQPYLTAGWLWYILTLLPVIGLIQQGADFARADRYTYLPLIGVFIMIAWGGKELAERLALSNLVMAWGTSLILSACVALSIIQTGYWRNGEVLFAHTLSLSPGNHVALQQLGVEYRERGELEKAYGFLAEDVRLNPENLDALANFGQLLDRMGRLSEAIDYHQKALKRAPFNPELHMNLGQLKARQGDLAGAETSFNRALELRPDFLPVRINLGYVLYLAKGYAAAADQFSLVLKDDPQSADAHNGLGLVNMAQGHLEVAANNFNNALRFNPGLQSARDNLQQAQKMLSKPVL